MLPTGRTKLLMSVSVFLILLLALAGCSSSEKGKYPSKNVLIVNPYKVGGANDNAARAIQVPFQKYLGVPVNLESHEGGGGAIGRNYAYEQPADGYTILMTMNTYPLNSELHRQQGANKYKGDFLDAFTPVASWLNGDGNSLITKKDSPIKTFQNLIDEAKKREITLAIAGSVGSSDHAGALILEKAMGIKFKLVPYNGTAEVAMAVRGGIVEAGSANVTADAMDPAALNFLAVSTEKRVAKVPDTPTFAELGLPQMTMPVLFGAAVKKGTPEDRIKVLEDALSKAFNDEVYQKWAKDMKQPIGDFYNRQKFTELIQLYWDNSKKILPELEESTKSVQTGK